jgi:hypothetical protein
MKCSRFKRLQIFICGAVFALVNCGWLLTAAQYCWTEAELLTAAQYCWTEAELLTVAQHCWAEAGF